PTDNDAEDIAADRLDQGLLVAAGVEEASPGDEPRPDDEVAAERAEAKERPYRPEHRDAQRKRNKLRHSTLPVSVGASPACSAQAAALFGRHYVNSTSPK